MLNQYEEDHKATYLDPIPVYSSKERFKGYMVECEHFKEMYLTASEGGEDLSAMKNQAVLKESHEVRVRKKPNEDKHSFKEAKRIRGSYSDFIIFRLKTVYISLIFAHICLFPAAYRFVPGWSPSKNLVCILALRVVTLVRI
jgi:hypothetical protein